MNANSSTIYKIDNVRYFSQQNKTFKYAKYLSLFILVSGFLFLGQ